MLEQSITPRHTCYDGDAWIADAVTSGGPLVILYSNDLEQSFAAVRDAGGDITQDIFSFPGGRRFHFTDTSGNELAVRSES